MAELHLELPAGVEPDEATLALSIRLYQTGRLSLGQAARLAGYSKRTYLEILGKQQVPIIDYPAEDLEGELRDEA
ncbi:MAG: UPF0175 family protein [Bacteroidota bacterium]